MCTWDMENSPFFRLIILLSLSASISRLSTHITASMCTGYCYDVPCHAGFYITKEPFNTTGDIRAIQLYFEWP